MNIKIYIRPSSKEKSKLASIRVRLAAGREIDLHAKTLISVRPDQWSNETQNYRQRSDTKNLDRKKQQIRDLRTFIEDEFALATNKGSINSAWLADTISRFENPDAAKSGKPGTLTEFIEDFIQKAETRTNPKTGRPVSYKQQREYARTFYYLTEFFKEKNRSYDFQDIDLDFYDDFKYFLEKKGRAVNTIGKKIQTLKIFLNEASYRGYRVNQLYKSGRFIAVKEETDAIYLSEKELSDIFHKDFSEYLHLDRVRDLFIIGSWTGLRFSDLYQVKKENISDGMLHITQGKTGGKVIIPIHPVVSSILEKYDNELPRIISNQKFNVALKEVAKAAKIKSEVHKGITRGGIRSSKKYMKWELVTTHTARRSFATNLYKNGFPSQGIMRITGHTTETAFLKYIRITPDEHAKMLELHWKEKNSQLKVV